MLRNAILRRGNFQLKRDRINTATIIDRAFFDNKQKKKNIILIVINNIIINNNIL